ncbi:hypothetical protein [Paracoccus sp. (in: a-proteobacteria)]|uniref:hypothetical protein n=1 Tax=Paracoccus sp. TaxID=267 RepID=UPI00396CE920
MAMLSLREAAQLCGRGKSTIQAAIKDGRLSASRNEQRGYEIDPSELHRVFPFEVSDNRPDEGSDRTQQDSKKDVSDECPVVSGSDREASIRTGQDVSVSAMRIRHLEELLEAERAGRNDLKQALQARADDLQETIADLRKRLDVAEEEKMRLLPAPEKKVAPALGQGGLWSRLTGR